MTAPNPYSLTHLDDAALLARLHDLVAQEQQHTAALLAHLAEVDARRLYRQAACASLFAYCTEILHYAEGAAYKRITAARAARQYPLIFDLVARGALHLAAVCLLAPHLDAHNHGALLQAAVHRSKRQVEELVAAHAPRPAVPALVRRLPAPASAPPAAAPVALPGAATAPVPVPAATAAGTAPPAASPPPPPPVLAPLAPDRYKVQFTASRALRDKLQQAQDLLRGPDLASGDLATVVERALDLLLRDLRRRKYGAAAAPRPPVPPAPGAPRRRRLPHATRRAVAARDQERCAFVDPRSGKRCTATTRLHFHHREPWARGGGDGPDNLALFCAAHDALQAEADYGQGLVAARIAARRAAAATAAAEDAERGSATAPGDSPTPSSSR